MRLHFLGYRALLQNLPVFITIIERACVESAATITKSGPLMPRIVSISRKLQNNKSYQNSELQMTAVVNLPILSPVPPSEFDFSEKSYCNP